MEWVLAAGVCAGVALGVIAGVLLSGWLARRYRAGDDTGLVTPLKEAGRRSVDVLRVGVLVLDEQDAVLVANPAAREMGLVRAAAHREGDGPGTVAHGVVRSLAGQTRRTGDRREVELELPRRDREPLGLRIRAVALGDGLVTVEAADTTESHRVARVRRDFVANVSHELKTPVGALQLLAEALLDATARDATAPQATARDGDGAGPDPAAARRFAERIQHESTRLGRLVSELIELSRLQGGEPLPEPVPVSVDRLIAEVVDRNRTAAAAKGIEVGVTGERELTVYGNEGQLVTALGNLVENAIAYSRDPVDGVPPGRVVITTRVHDDLVDVSVADQGIGIDPKDRDRIFERFYRADRARSRATGGTGLGLAIVKHIATNHGGQVDVASTIGAGSTFTLRLPARPRDIALPPPDADDLVSRRDTAGSASWRDTAGSGGQSGTAGSASQPRTADIVSQAEIPPARAKGF